MITYSIFSSSIINSYSHAFHIVINSFFNINNIVINYLLYIKQMLVKSSCFILTKRPKAPVLNTLRRKIKSYNTFLFHLNINAFFKKLKLKSTIFWDLKVNVKKLCEELFEVIFNIKSYN